MKKKFTDSDRLAVSVNPLKIAMFLLAVVGVLITAHLVTQYLIYSNDFSDQVVRILRKFDMGEEISIPTWYSQVALMCASGILMVLAYKKMLLGVKYRYHWLFLSLMVLFMSVDEGAGIHEMGGMLNLSSRLGLESDVFAFGWVVPAIILVLIIGIMFVRFWWALPLRTGMLFLAAVTIFLTGAVSTEMASAAYMVNEGTDNFWYKGVLVTIEEGLEMIGVVVLVYTLLDYMGRENTNVAIRPNRSKE